MARTTDFKNIWQTVKEVDLRPIQQSAEHVPQFVVVGLDDAWRAQLIQDLRNDPFQPSVGVSTPVKSLELEDGLQSGPADLTILLLAEPQISQSAVAETLADWAEQGRKVLVIVGLPDKETNEGSSRQNQQNLVYHLGGDNRIRRVIYGPIDASTFLLNKLVPAVFQLLPAQVMALARHFPLFRVPAARRLINDTCLSNAAYAFSTGMAEIVPVLNLPLNVADMVVLTKAQAFLVYRLGLALGFSTSWQDYVAEFGGVLGGGFVWRQIARQLIGLVPAWGIIPKVAVSYAGTYVVGHVVLQWYITGKHISRQQIRQLYGRAFALGKQYAQSLVKKMPRPKLRRKARLPQPSIPPLISVRTCLYCGRHNSEDASFCQFCGEPI